MTTADDRPKRMSRKRSNKTTVVRWAVITDAGKCRGVFSTRADADRAACGIHDRIFKYVGRRRKSDGDK